MVFHLTEKQVALRDLAASPSQHILAYGGSRSGKTFGFCYCVATRAISAPDSRHLICRLHNIDVRQAVMMDTFPKMMREAYPQVTYKPNISDQYFQFDNGAQVWFGGLDDKERIDKILGKEYATIYPNECSQLPYDTITTLRTRLAQLCFKVNGKRLALKAYYDLNPVGRSHWTHREFVEGVRPENRLPLEPGTRRYVVINPDDNRENLPPEYFGTLDELPERQRQRFRDGKYLSEVPGALWPIDRLDATRRPRPNSEEDFLEWVGNNVQRIVVGVDPSGSDGTGGDSQGIVVAGKTFDGHGLILEDGSCRLSPAGWGQRAVQLYDKYNADCIVAEQNYGGAMVESTIRTARNTAKVKLVNASRGKHVRAEPTAALYEARENGAPARMHHMGMFTDLEDQMTMFTTEGYQGSGSPDRADAAVWAITELMLNQSTFTLANIN